MPRNFPNWIDAYIEYASFDEAPLRLHFWSAVSAVAGALRRCVWIDMRKFKWLANFYIIVVAEPGYIKSSTVATSMKLLRKVPGIKFGPDVVTWQALVTAFSASHEGFEVDGNQQSMSAMTIESSEFGNLFDPEDRRMVDLFVHLWDGKDEPFEKITKMDGSEVINGPWINLIACTTPAWIAGNFPEYMIGGGFTARCIFVYIDEKKQLVPYPDEVAPPNYAHTAELLVQDLEHISITLRGGYQICEEARAWGREWYTKLWGSKPPSASNEGFKNYLARKQTHIHKLAMVLAAAQRDELVIQRDDLIVANDMVTDLELEMPKVFSRVGRSEVSVQSERFIAYIRQNKRVPYTQAYRFIHAQFPDSREFEGIVAGAVKAGYIKLVQEEAGWVFEAVSVQ